MIRRLIGWLFPQPSPEDLARVRPLLKLIEAHDGLIVDGEAEVDEEAARLADRLGLITHGGGWSIGIRLTAKGERALRSSGL